MWHRKSDLKLGYKMGYKMGHKLIIKTYKSLFLYNFLQHFVSYSRSQRFPNKKKCRLRAVFAASDRLRPS